MSETETLCAVTTSPLATRDLGAALAGLVRDGDVILLTGDLGAGKTRLVQGVGEALEVDDRITSPTFTLIAVHHGRLRLNHLDVYRLDDPHQILDLDLPELVEHGVTIVEWGEIIAPALPPDRLTIELRFDAGGIDDDRRQLRLGLEGSSWQARAGELTTALEPWLAPC